MNPSLPPYEIFPLGDTAITLDFGNSINGRLNSAVMGLYHDLNASPLAGMKELVPAYSSLTIFYDPLVLPRAAGQTAFDTIKSELKQYISRVSLPAAVAGRLLEIPVCYDEQYAPDLQALASAKNYSVDEVIHIHTACEYRIYMMGFLPGFAYMGVVDEKIATPRKPLPGPVRAGSVGIAGNQTGIYPLDSPGGWQIIGRSPRQFFDPARTEPVLLRAGDRIRFYSISSDEFENYKAGNA